MSDTTVGAHCCVINPRLKDAQEGSLPGGKYGRMFPGLPSCEVDFESAVSLGRATSRMDATLPVVDRALENRRIPAGFAILGQFVAHDITAVEPLTAEECGLSAAGWTAETPLWYYVFKEAEVRACGEHLGPVGGRIVAEVLLGLLDTDPGSYRRAQPDWRPELPSEKAGEFGMVDLLVLARAS